MILIAPIPAKMSGFAEEESVELQEDVENFSAWLNALTSEYPAAYGHIISYLQAVIPDLDSFVRAPRGEKGKQLRVTFVKEKGGDVLTLDFEKLSDGEKCFFLSALIAAANKVSGPVFCMWDEPDNHLSLSEVSHFILHLRKLTNQNGQVIVVSHHPTAIRRFADENTLVFTRKSHLEPTVVQPLADFHYSGDLVEALARDEVIG
jgi:predicted ATPase